MNLTDVDDRIINIVKKEDLDLYDFTKKYAESFFEDLDFLGVKVVLTKVLKTGQTDPSGAPIYVIQHQPAIQVLTREEYNSMTSRSTIPK